MTTNLQFQGFSDDLVHVAVNGKFKEYNVLSKMPNNTPATFAVYDRNTYVSTEFSTVNPIFYVYAHYGLNGGTWSFGVEQTEEDIFLPELVIDLYSRRNRSPYSTVLNILIADENINAYVVLL